MFYGAVIVWTGWVSWSSGVRMGCRWDGMVQAELVGWLVGWLIGLGGHDRLDWTALDSPVADFVGCSQHQ